jgi:hypothetical protein
VLLITLSEPLLFRLPSERITGDFAFDNKPSFYVPSQFEMKDSLGQALLLPRR